jgi:hypothetical protein
MFLGASSSHSGPMNRAIEPGFIFINLSHPDELKDQKMVDHIRCSAMMNYGRMKRTRQPHTEGHQIFVGVRAADNPALSAVSIGVSAPFASHELDVDAKGSERRDDSECTTAIEKTHV